MRRRDKLIVAIISAVLLACLGGVAAWAAIRPGSYGHSGNGCVTVTIPSTTGGAIVHECGDRAKALCQNAFAHGDRLSLLIRPECRKAGLG